MPMKMTEEEYAEMRRKSAQIRGGSNNAPGGPKQASKMQAWKSRKVKATEPGYTETAGGKIKRVVTSAAKKVWNAAGEGRDRYVGAREESHRRLERATHEERERVSDSWAGVPVWNTSTLPKRKSKSKKKVSSRSGSSNDYYPVYLTNTLTGASYGGGLGGFGVGSSLPKKSTTTKRKKKPTTRRRRY